MFNNKIDFKFIVLVYMRMIVFTTCERSLKLFCKVLLNANIARQCTGVNFDIF